MLHAINELLVNYSKPGVVKVLDPFAGTGRIHNLVDRDGRSFTTFGVELEPEWAGMSSLTQVGDATRLVFPENYFDAVATSPTFGNRMADHHEAKDDSRRMTYRHVLGRALTDGNSGMMQWGDQYREMHIVAWCEVRRVVKPGGLFVLNMADHIRGKKRVHVTDWHDQVLQKRLSFRSVETVRIPKRGMRFGENSESRVNHETVTVYENP